MLQAAVIAEDKERVVAALRKRNFADLHLVDEVIELDAHRRKLKHALDTTLAESNQISKQVGKLFSEGKKTGSRNAESAFG